MNMNMCMIMTMNIYITKENEEFLRRIKPGQSMSGLINELLDKYRNGKGPDLFPPEIELGMGKPISKEELPKIAEEMGDLNGVFNTGTKPRAVIEELSCCKQESPCKHWQFNGEAWVNQLSGKVRDVVKDRLKREEEK